MASLLQSCNEEFSITVPHRLPTPRVAEHRSKVMCAERRMEWARFVDRNGVVTRNCVKPASFKEVLSKLVNRSLTSKPTFWIKGLSRVIKMELGSPKTDIAPPPQLN